MCDTFVAAADATADGSVILGKNSDREPNEAHELATVAAADHPATATVDCTYLEIDQVAHTRAVLLAKPYWIWGAEMGVNDAGVAIGNEAVFTKAPREQTVGLLGMDLLRLALERASSASEAATVITDLLTRHGQYGQAGHTHDLFYDNSYVIADTQGALVLETMGRDWVLRKVVTSDSISNALTTRTTWDEASPGVAATGGDRDVARHYSDFLYTTFSAAKTRQCRTSGRLSELRGRFKVGDAMALLRDHGPRGKEPGWTPDRALTGQTVCAHAGFGPVRVAQSTGSMVVELSHSGPTIWLTGTSAPCTSIFKPVWLDSGLPDTGRSPGKTFNRESLWWRHEVLHRAILADYANRMTPFADRRNKLESRWVTATRGVTDAATRRRLTVAAFDEAADFEREWFAATATPSEHRGPVGRVVTTPFHHAWRGFNRRAQMPGADG